MTDIGWHKLNDLAEWAETGSSDHLRHIAQRLVEHANFLQRTGNPRGAIICLGLAGRFEALAIVPRGTSLTSG